MNANHLLETLTNLRVFIIHPHDREGEILIEQLKRIGCQVETIWPLPKSLPPIADVVIVSVQQEILTDIRRLWANDSASKPTLIAVVAYEAPTILQVVIDINADGVITKPICSFGVMTNLVAARKVWLRENNHRDKLNKLQKKLKGVNIINKAKFMLMNTLNVNDADAYKVIRDRAMQKRVTIEEMAVSINNANELLQSIKKND